MSQRPFQPPAVIRSQDGVSHGDLDAQPVRDLGGDGDIEPLVLARLFVQRRCRRVRGVGRDPDLASFADVGEQVAGGGVVGADAGAGGRTGGGAPVAAAVVAAVVTAGRCDEREHTDHHDDPAESELPHRSSFRERAERHPPCGADYRRVSSGRAMQGATRGGRLSDSRRVVFADSRRIARATRRRGHRGTGEVRPEQFRVPAGCHQSTQHTVDRRQDLGFGPGGSDHVDLTGSVPAPHP